MPIYGINERYEQAEKANAKKTKKIAKDTDGKVFTRKNQALGCPNGRKTVYGGFPSRSMVGDWAAGYT